MKICIVFMILNYQGKYRLVENNQTALQHFNTFLYKCSEIRNLF